MSDGCFSVVTSQTVWRRQELNLDEGCSVADASEENHGIFTFPMFRKKGDDVQLPQKVISGQVVDTCTDGALNVDLLANRRFTFSMNPHDLPHPSKIMGRRGSRKKSGMTSKNTLGHKYDGSMQTPFTDLKSKQAQLDTIQITPCLPVNATKTEDGNNDKAKLWSFMMNRDGTAQDNGAIAKQDHRTAATMPSKQFKWCAHGKPFNGESTIWCEVERSPPFVEARPTRQPHSMESFLAANMYSRVEE